MYNYMKQWEVIFEQVETFKVEVEAETEQEADDKAMEEFNNGNYTDLGDCSVENVSTKEIQ